jgi:hypothetical protein
MTCNGQNINSIEGDFSSNDFLLTDFLTMESSLEIPVMFKTVKESLQNKNSLNFFPLGSSENSNYLIQNLGKTNRNFSISGDILLTSQDVATNAKTHFRSLVGEQGTLESEFIPELNISYEKVEFNDDEKEPEKIGFIIEVKEI